MPYVKSVGTGFYLTEPAVSPTRRPAVWYILGIRVPVPCLTVTLWYDGQRQVVFAPTTPDVLHPIGPIAVAPGPSVQIDQAFGPYRTPRTGTHVLTLAGYFLRDELYAPPAHGLDRMSK